MAGAEVGEGGLDKEGSSLQALPLGSGARAIADGVAKMDGVERESGSERGLGLATSFGGITTESRHGVSSALVVWYPMQAKGMRVTQVAPYEDELAEALLPPPCCLDLEPLGLHLS